MIPESTIIPQGPMIFSVCLFNSSRTRSLRATHKDEVINPLPGYFSHLMWLSIRGIMPPFLSFDTKTAKPDPEQAAALISPRTRAIVLVTPNSPSGAIYSPVRIETFYQLARTHDIALIIDETYHDFIYDKSTIHGVFGHHDWRNHFVH